MRDRPDRGKLRSRGEAVSREPELYRTPRKPGYLGGYNWRATAFGFLLLTAVNFAATQYIAAQFRYQPALGRPMVQIRTGPLYQPFAWTVWGWYNSTSQDPRIRKPLFIGEMIVFAGSFISVAIFFVMANRRSRRLMENAEDLHGSARWANETDIRQTGLLSARQGVYVGAWSKEASYRLHYLRHDGPEHVLAFRGELLGARLIS